MNNKYNKRVYAGYYKRYDGKLIYVITIAKDELSGEDTVIYTPYSLKNDGGYFTISKRHFCEPVKIDGKLKVRYKRQTQMRITDDFLETLMYDDLPAPKRKLPPKPDELKSRTYRQSDTYYDYAKDLCTNYLADIRRYNYLKTTGSVLENYDNAKEVKDTRGDCKTRHYVRADALEQVVMLELKRLAGFLESNEEEFASFLQRKLMQICLMNRNILRVSSAEQ